MFTNVSTIGSLGEKIAVSYLKKQGYQILEQNYCNTTGRRLGEIDIIATDAGCLAFIEVKTRIVKHNHIVPEENIGRQKLYKLNKIATQYIQKNNLWQKPYRFDAIAITLTENRELLNLNHLRDIFL